MPEVTLEGFTAWLEGKGEEVVGRARLHCDCPLANWLTELYGSRVSVAGSTYYVADRAKVELSGWWMRWVVARVDMFPQHMTVRADWLLKRLKEPVVVTGNI